MNISGLGNTCGINASNIKQYKALKRKGLVYQNYCKNEALVMSSEERIIIEHSVEEMVVGDRWMVLIRMAIY